MASKGINPILLVGGGIAAAYLLLKPSTPVPGTVVAPGTTVVPGGSILSTLLPGTTQTAIPTTYGINSGVRGGNGSFYTCANYSTLLAANPNLGNPNYQMSAGESAQYVANYLDLQQGLPSWIGQSEPDKIKITNLSQAAQEHWKYYGCAEQRIFLPLQPPSTSAYIPPPANPAAKPGSSGSSWVGTAISTAGTIAIALLGNENPLVPELNNAEINIIVTGSAIIKNILGFYLQVDPNLVNSINLKVDTLLSQYQN